MPNSVPFRTSPQLGPQLDDVYVGLPYWDLGLGVGLPTIGTEAQPSYKLGNRETGNDGYDYIWLQNGGTNLAANARANFNATTFVATANGTGVVQGPPVVVPANAYFHARVFTI